MNTLKIFTPPNLSDRFILATTDLSKVKGTGGSSTTSPNGAHTHGLSGLSAEATTLNDSQMPHHRHKAVEYSDGLFAVDPYGDASAASGRYIYSGDGTDAVLNTQFAGGSQPHTHTVSGGTADSAGDHTHSIAPPYYKLALIAYIGA